MKHYKTKEEAIEEFRGRYDEMLLKAGVELGKNYGGVGPDFYTPIKGFISQVWDSAFEAGRKELKNTTKT